MALAQALRHIWHLHAQNSFLKLALNRLHGRCEHCRCSELCHAQKLKVSCNAGNLLALTVVSWLHVLAPVGFQHNKIQPMHAQACCRAIAQGDSPVNAS